jgi:hypothetical protein
MQSNVGKKFAGNNLKWMRAASLVKSLSLPDGKVELEYSLYGECRYFFEIDSSTNIIENWRYEGSDKDCAIAN